MVKMMIAKDDRPYLSCFLEVGEDNGGRCLASRTGHGTRDGGLQKGFYNVSSQGTIAIIPGTHL